MANPQFENGFISLDRKILNWEWYDDMNTMRLFLHLLLTVNYEDKRWHGIEVKRGQRITSLPKLAKETRLSVQSVRTSLNHLKSTGEITDEGFSFYRLVTVIKYNEYQDPNRRTNRRLTDDQQTTNSNITKITKKQDNNLLVVGGEAATATPKEEGIFYRTFKEQCTKRLLSVSISESRYLEMKAEYELKLMWWPEVQKCLAWLFDNHKKNISAGRLRNWMNNCLKFNKEKEIKARQEFQDKKFAPVKKPLSSSQIPVWTPPS